LRAVDGVSMTIFPGQTLGVVGESGCGKSVTALATLGLLSKHARIDDGSITFTHDNRSQDLLTLPERALRRIRGGDIAMIFQEPMTSLNPVYTVGEQVIEALHLHASVGLSQSDLRQRALDAMHDIGIQEPAKRIDQYPHQFSGGMRQRIMIAMALACKPKLLLADEPTTALDVTVQAQVLDLLSELKRTTGLGIMLITHDLGVVAQHADVVCVMYAGRVVEYARARDLFARPLHPYTRALLACAPRLGDRKARLATVRELVDDPALVTHVQQSAAQSPLGPVAAAAAELKPWWLWHETPPHVSTDMHTLREVLPGHWLGLWSNPAALTLPTTSPHLA
jgi:ABC-type dipeptide/oligopeptide/nickel transport system ATPase component